MTNRNQSPRCALLAACVFLLLFTSCLHCRAQAPANPEGSWQGTLGAGAVKLRLVLTFTKSADGGYKAVMDSVDQGATIPGDKVTLAGDKLRVEFERVNGFYEGVINQDGSEIAGTWTQNSIPQPLTFKRAQPGSAAKEAAKPATAEKPFTAPIDVTVPIAPIAFQADGKTHLAYELHITNFSAQSITLTRIEVLSDSGNSLTRLDQSDLLANVLLIGNYQTAGMDKLNLAPGQMANVYMWVTLDNPAKVPAAIEHKITVKAGKNHDEVTAKCARAVVGREIATIAAPLRGDNWLAGNGPANNGSGHRRALIPVDGRAQIAQRFAIDWVRLNADGKTFTGDPKDNKNYRAYGNDALAVADGIVTETKDGIPENVPGIDSRAVPITLETIGGNHVILDIGHGRYALYAHLQPGSLKVKLGDHVKRGQVLGLVGNSGNSIEPHLHFHLSDANSLLGSEGIPYALESFDAKPKAGAPATKHRTEIPTENEIVTFAEK
jgi:murein DD-endopeptidase MepM/ murein hydrolase activator NlpD